MLNCVLFYLAEKIIVDGLVVSFFVRLALYLYKNIEKPEMSFKREDTYHQSIVAAAHAGTLTLEDFLERCGHDDNASIEEVHIMGSDSSGDRMYFSQAYKLNQGALEKA